MPRRLLALTALVALGLIASAGPAAAHVTIAQTEQTAGDFTVLSFGVGHGCEGSPTVELAIQVPQEVANVTPAIVPGWDIEIETEDLDEPIEGSHGEVIESREAVVVYSGSLEDGFRTTFDIGLQVPEDFEGTMFWPTVQTCEEGDHPWIEIPEEGEDPFELDEPAPFINVSAGGGDGHGHDDDEAEAEEAATEGGAPDVAEVSLDAEETDAPADLETELTATTTDGGSNDTLSIVALVAGLLGVGFGVAGFTTARRARTGS